MRQCPVYDPASCLTKQMRMNIFGQFSTTGGPGSGKGTQCQTVATRMGFVAVALSHCTWWWVCSYYEEEKEQIQLFQLHSLIKWRPAAKWGDGKHYFLSWNENVSFRVQRCIRCCLKAREGCRFFGWWRPASLSQLFTPSCQLFPCAAACVLPSMI